MNDWYENHYKSFKLVKDNENNSIWEDFQKEVKKLYKKDRLTLSPTKKVRLPSNNVLNLRIANSIDFSSVKKDLESFNKNVKKKIQREKINIEATLDLHGLSIIEAEIVVINFIRNCYIQSQTYILIITGKGNKEYIDDISKATLKTELPRFLSHPSIAPIIISFIQAGKKHGSTGAFYILLRKNV